MKRIHRLLYPSKAPVSWMPVAAAVILLFTAGAALAMWPPRPMQHDSTAAQSNEEQDQKSKYDKWLKEDVVYIITPEEAEAFTKLKEDEEREKFIEQFWERRNPNPGSSENKFKEEHYRRIAYSNKHFADSKAGWQTDRGHIYIVYGPPDQVDSHPDGKPHPYEEWMYKHTADHGDNWVVTFTDRSGKGEYELAPTAMNEQSGRSDLPESGKNGYGYPACVYCPQAEYTPEALEHKIQGTVTLTTVITADGVAKDVKVTKGMEYGLSDKAIEAVSRWRFKPALGPDGKPAAVRQLIEVAFHRY